MCVYVYSCLIQHTKRMRHFMSVSVFCLALPCFSTLSDERHDFVGKKRTLNFLYKCCLKNFSF